MDDSLEQDRREKDDAPLGAPRVMCENCAEYLAGWKRAMADYQNRQTGKTEPKVKLGEDNNSIDLKDKAS